MGYPFGIPGDKLLIESRILAIADAFDAMTSNRPYRKALSPEKAMREIIDNAGRQHDPVLVRHFVELIENGTFDHLISPADNRCVDFDYTPKFSYGSGISV
jgi:HD-GYP domain-containing protein (c-di-GMP phosphodiesterase class II)